MKLRINVITYFTTSNEKVILSSNKFMVQYELESYKIWQNMTFENGKKNQGSTENQLNRHWRRKITLGLFIKIPNPIFNRWGLFNGYFLKVLHTAVVECILSVYMGLP